jgi:hypothetical protein
LNVQNIRLMGPGIALKVKIAWRLCVRASLKVKRGSHGAVGPKHFATAQKNTPRGLAGAFV